MFITFNCARFEGLPLPAFDATVCLDETPSTLYNGTQIGTHRRERLMLIPSERAIQSKVTWRLLPFLFLLYIVAYLDRANLSVAKLGMKEMPWFTDNVFGLGAGIFFLGYFLFEVPSNLILAKVGARKWITRIMISWGIVSSLMMFSLNEPAFYGLRFMLGVAEAGFFPGVILYLTYWYTARERARIVAIFMTATAVANVIGAPLSGLLLGVHGFGLLGWQWLFVIEGIPAILLGFVVFFYLPDGPKDARWLTAPEKEWILARIEVENASKSSTGHGNLSAAFSTPAVWIFCAIYFVNAMTTYGIVNWLPTIIKKSGTFDDIKVGLLTAIPFALGAIVMVFTARNSDRTGKHREHVAGAAFICGIGLIIAAFQHTTLGIVASFSFAAMGLYSLVGPFWALPTSILGGTAAAAGIALINSIGNLGGFAGPYLVGRIKDADKVNGTQNALLMLAFCIVFGGVLAFAVKREHTPDANAAI